MKRRIQLLILMVFSATIIYPCTTIVVSGRCTPDGRPLLFKHRDTGWLSNKVMYVKGEKYDFIGVVNSCNQIGDTVWMGTNSAGFAIMNSASYNINDDDSLYLSVNEGVIMKRALEICADLKDFEHFLDTLTRPMYVGANFGVIDAEGGAAYYETGNFGYVKFDVNDPETAPDGYLIRTNFSLTGRTDEGHGYIRFKTTSRLFEEAYKMGNVNERFIFTGIDRCLQNSLTETDYSQLFPESEDEQKFVPGIDLTMRNSSASTFLCKGVKAGEDPALSIIWIILGYQLCTPAIPLWVGTGNNIPEILKGDESSLAPLCSAALQLKNKIYSVTRGHGSDYIDLAKISNKKGTGIYQSIRVIEDEIFDQARPVVDEFYKNGFDQNKILEFYKWVNDFVKREYADTFNIRM